MAEQWSTDRGLLRLERPLAGIVLTRVEGFAGVELGDRIISWVDSAIEDGETPAVFHDWELATGYEPAVRPRFTEWYMRIRRSVGAIHVLARSKLVTMGVSLVSLATGSEIFAYRERLLFTKAFDAAVLEAKMSGRRRTADAGS